MFVYNPNLGSVGSGASYNPGPVDQDALALNFLGYNAGFPGSGPRGAWDATFQSGLKAFQTNNGLTVDGWIGPKSRAKLKEKVDEKQRGGAFPAPIPSAPVVPTLPTNVPFLYVPNLGSVGSGASYNPGPVDQDAAALNYLGYSAGSPPPQKAIGSGGAWDPTFRAAVTAFQKANGLTADSWIGPKTRTTIAKKVTEKNMGMGAQPVTSGIGVSGVDRRTGQKRIAKVASESGVRLRSQPKGDSEIYGVLPAGTSVQLVKMCPGNKVEGVSPGPGGWALVDVAGRRGWVVSEWLVLS
jgi:peptidoglycan hydrolase-like protein with peptidoglycan-binding domain